MCTCVHLCLWTCVHVCVFEDVCVCVCVCVRVWVTYNYHGAARQFPELSSRGLLMGFSLHADAQNREGWGGGRTVAWREIQSGACVCVCVCVWGGEPVRQKGWGIAARGAVQEWLTGYLSCNILQECSAKPQFIIRTPDIAKFCVTWENRRKSSPDKALEARLSNLAKFTMLTLIGSRRLLFQMEDLLPYTCISYSSWLEVSSSAISIPLSN